jgi:signal transduction histidine kinase
MATVEESRDRKDILLEAGLTLASELSLPIVLQRIVDLAAQITDARYGALGVIGEGEVLTEFVTTGMAARQRKAIGPLPTGRGVLGLLIREPRPVRLANIGDHAMSVGFPPNHPPMRAFLGAPIKAMGRVFGNIYLADKRSADEFSEADEEALVVLATQAGIAIANATLYEEVRSREHWLGALNDITNLVLSGAKEASLLESIAEHARALVGADAATIATLDGPGPDLVISAAVGSRAADLIGHAVPASDSVSGHVLRSGESVVFVDVTTESRAYQPIARLGHHGPTLFVPLRVPGGIKGTLMVANLRGGRRFEEKDRQLVESFADAASVAIDYDRVQAEVRRLGLMEERERIAKELHDGIIQSLFAVGMSLQGTALMAGSEEVSVRIEHAVEELDRVIRDLRNYIFGLRPGILADRQLDQALRELGAQMQARSRETVEIVVDSALAARLSARSAEIVQLTREALSNAARHAQAKRVVVRLERNGSNAVLSIEDDGVGFASDHPSDGNGLRNMRERAAGLGGTLKLASKPGKGTTLRIAFPV